MLSIRLITKVKNCVLTLGLTQTQEVTYLLHVLSHNNCAVIQVSLLLLGLLCQDVAVVCVMTLYLACTGECESLLSTGISLYFWHNCFNLFN